MDDGNPLASRAVIVDPEKRRAAQPLSLRGGPTRSRHRSDQLAALDVVVRSGWHTGRPPRKLRFATFFGPSPRVDFTARSARGLPVVGRPPPLADACVLDAVSRVSGIDREPTCERVCAVKSGVFLVG